MIKNKQLTLTLEEATALDNELFATQCKLRHLEFRNVDDPIPSKEELRYREVISSVRMKVIKLLERTAVEKHLSSAINE